MKETKRIIAILLIPILLFMQNGIVSAETLSREAVYDLEKGGTQTFLVQDENGEIGEVVIYEIEENARVGNGKYEVSYNNKGYWKAGFYVQVENNKITSAYSPFYDTTYGTISEAYLNKNSTVKVTYSFLYKHLLTVHETGVIASIKNNDLVVTKKIKGKIPL